MTIDEAAIAMRLQNSLVTLDSNLLYGIYLDSGNNQYHVYFSGTIPKVSFWSVCEFEDAKPVDPEKLHPEYILLKLPYF